MAMIRCDHGHFFDNAKHSTCPYCGVMDLDISPTIPKRSEPVFTPTDDSGKTIPISTPAKASAPSAAPGSTVGIFKKQSGGLDPVCGWLVCISGAEKGHDFRIKAQRNFIGRDAAMDIAIQGDDTISREKHAVISYDPKSNSFRLAPGDGRGMTYLNDQPVDMPTVLKPYDKIEIGQSQFLFIPFCGDTFTWA